MFRTRETQLGPGALSTPGTAVPATARCNPWPPHAASQRPVPVTPALLFPSRGAQITGHQQGFTSVHPSQPFPRLCSPDGTGTLGPFPELRTRPGKTQPRTSGRERASGTARSHVISTADLLRRTHSSRATSCRTCSLSCSSPASGPVHPRTRMRSNLRRGRPRTPANPPRSSF
jgi:hypothetical protein